MKSRMPAMMILGALLCCVGAVGAEKALKGAKTKLEIAPPVERKWQHWGNKMGVDYYGTFDHVSSNRVYIKDAWGELMEIPLFYCSPPDLSYMLNRMAKFPEYITDHKIDEGGRRKLIDLKVDELPLGEFKHWENHGELGGGFHSMNVTPVVEMVKGRKGLRFEVSAVSHIKTRYQMLTSDFTVTDYLGENKPFTMSAWVYDPDSPEDNEATVMSWHSIGGDHGTRLTFTDFNCDIGGMSATSRGMAGQNKGGLGLHPSNEWQHVTYVYTGGTDGELRVYKNGELVSKHRYDCIPRKRPLAINEIGTSNAVVRADLLAKSGKASVGLYYDVVDHHYWFQQRHWFWQEERKIEWAPEGEIRFDLTNLKPGTKYYYRIMAIDRDADWWGYQNNPMRRWMYGPGVFVTATGDGKPGYNVPEDTRKHFFIGANWGSFWYYAYPGPRGFLDAHVGDMKLYDYAMDELEVRMNAGLPNAFEPVPADDAALMVMKTGFSWQQGSKGVAKYKVYRSNDREAVAKGTAESLVTDKPGLDAVELERGTRYYWRVAQLDGKGNVLTDGDIWTFRTLIGEARDPKPEDGATINPILELEWTPPHNPGTNVVRVYLAESIKELEQMRKPTAELKPYAGKWLMSAYKPGPDILRHGMTYFWRVDTVHDDGHIAPSKTWRFHVRDYVTPEPDSIIPEPMPDNFAAAAHGAKMMEPSMGFPGLASPGADNDAFLQVALGTRRYLEKSRLARDIVYYWNCGHVLGSYEGSGFASGFMTGSYGGFYMQDGKEVLQTLLFHETGHQMHGVFNTSDPEFRMINRQVWLDHADDNASLGGYDANNEFEQMAVHGQGFMHAPARYRMYHDNRSQYIALQPHMPGDLCVELDTDHGLKTGGDSVLLAWQNKGGLLDWIDSAWRNMAGTAGEFAAIGAPTLETVRGVPAVTFSGNDALEWEFRTKYGLHGNRDFAVEFWALKNEAGGPGQVLAGWGDEAGGARFFWGSDDVAYKHCGDISGNWGEKPGVGEWQHIVHAFRGGGKKNGPGPYLLYVNGKLVRQGTHRFNLAENARVFVGGVPVDGRVTGGFKGSLAHVRIYNYDISDDQIAEHYTEEAPYYRKPYGHIAEKLYVDMDVRRPADVPRREHNPMYPEKMHRPWLRSWANHGTLSGRLHNDIHSYMWGPSHSTPTPKEIAGINAPVFGGKDRMFSGFKPDAEMLAGAPGTLEAWVYSDAKSADEVVLEWGGFALDARWLKLGWQHVALIFTPGDNAKKTPRPGNWKPAGKTRVYVNGKEAGELDGVMWPDRHQRLHVGGHYDPVRWNWKRYFNGAVAALRIHKGRLTPDQIAENFRTHAFNNAHAPVPAIDGVVVAARKPALSWSPGVVGGQAKETVYLGESPDSLKALGEFAPGECKPPLEPGRPYYWRVGGSDTWGFKTRQGLLVDLDSADLPEGELKKWVNKGRHGGAFAPGSAPDTWTPVSKTHLGVSGMTLTTGKRMESTFDAPANMTNGSFTIFYRAARQIRDGGIPILSWGPPETGAECLHTTGAPFVWGKVKNRERGDWEHAVPRYTEDERRANQLATLSAMAYLWKSQCVTYENATFKYYSDGRLVNEVKKEFSLPEAGRMIIGGEGVETYLKELKVFSKALSAKDVAALHKGEKVAAREMLVAVTVPDQADGKRISRLENNGSLKGEFVAMPPAAKDYVPSVKTVDGVKCAYFDGGSEFLESDKLMPAEFAGTKPFTVEARVKIENDGAFFALAPEVAAPGCGSANVGRHVDFSVTGIGARARSGFRAPANKWTHLALVYDGGYRSRFKMYVNGELQEGATREFVNLATIEGYPMYAGACFNTYSGAVRPFKGGIARIRAYDYVRTPEEIAAAAKH